MPRTPRLLPSRARASTAACLRLAVVALGLVLSAAACGREPAGPVVDDPPATPAVTPPPIPFPDSVTEGRGLPPQVMDSTTRRLGGDTLVVSHVAVFPAYALRPEQVPAGQPTSRPMHVHVRVFGRDTSSGVLHERALAFAECPVTLRLYRTADRSGTPAWRSDAAPASVGCPTVTRYASNDAVVEWAVPAILGDSLPAGHYALAHAVRLADGRVLEFATGGAYLTADPAPPTRDRSTLRMTARSEVVGQAPRSLRTTVVVTNTGTRAVQFEHGACTPVLRLYRGGTTSGRVVWRSELRRPAGTDPDRGFYGCPSVLLGKVIPPGDSAVFDAAIPLAEILADSLPGGTYAVRAELELLNDALPPDRWATVYPLHAGTVELPRAADPLPGSRMVDGLTYVATTRLVPGATPADDVVRTLVLVRNDGTARVEAEVPRDCPVIAYAYRSAALRDSFPIQQPVWQSAGCRLHPYRFALAPGESWVFAHEVRAAEIVARAGAGRYWFTAWVAGRPSVMLAAGETELRR